ncbi:MAG: DUF4190 domain-containing protein [Anaerolineaceae bacterium]|nr:DUF4190 domain-containing protein [Anaerolineaceae bacterium]
MSQEKLLRAVALGLAALWPVGLVLAVASATAEAGAVGVMAAVLVFLPYIGGPIVTVLLSREQGEGMGLGWAIMAFLFPVVVLPIVALRNVQWRRIPQTARLAVSADLAALDKALHAVKPPYLASNAAYALAGLGTDQAGQVLMTAMRDQQPGVRVAAAGGLGLLGPRALDVLLPAARDLDPQVREAVARSAGQIGGPQAEAALVALLDDRYPSVRAAAARALGQAGGPAALAPLAATLEDPVPAVRQRATDALARLATRGDEGQRAAAGQALLNRRQEHELSAGLAAATAPTAPADAAPACPARAVPASGPEARSDWPAPVAFPDAWHAVGAGEKSNLAVVSLVLGIAAWLLLPIIGALGAIVTGHLARRDVRQSEGRLGGSGMALAGLLLGYGQMAGIIILTLVLVVAGLLSNAGQRDLAGPAAASPVAPTERPVVLVVTATPAMPTPWYEATATAQALEIQQVSALQTAEAVQAASVQTAEAVQAASVQTAEAVQAGAQGSLSAAAGWPIVAQDTFEGPTTGVWPLGTFEDGMGVFTTTIESGGYRLAMDISQGSHRLIFPSTGTLTDFYLALDTRQLGGPAGTTYGIDFRVRDNAHMYYFCLYADQYYAVGRLEDGVWTNLSRGSAAAIRAAGPNRLAILAHGSRLTFFVNDVVVGAVDDATYDSGAIALGIELLQAGDKAVFEFDNVELRAPPAASLPGLGMQTATSPPPAATEGVWPTATAAPSTSH